MIPKDAIILSFYFDSSDPAEQTAYEEMKQQLDDRLKSMRLGKYDEDSYNARGGFFELHMLGYDAPSMLEAIKPVVKNAAFVIGPRATLIIRSYEQKGKPEIRHVDL